MKRNYKKMKLFFRAILFFSIATTSLHAQYENIWVFGGKDNRAVDTGFRLDFSGGNPVLSSIKFKAAGEAAASVCDSKGQLLFYTEGDTIWNRNSQVMPNGGGLTGLPTQNGGVVSVTASSSQGALIVPMPNNPDKYYIFSLIDIASSLALSCPGYLYYSIVDMTLNGGMGDVIPGQKGIFIDSGFAESVTGVAGDHCNVWIVAPAFSSISNKSDLFKVYELTENGLNMSPAIFNVGHGVLANTIYSNEFSNVKFSPDRKKLARSRFLSFEPNRLELYDFDPTKGTISNRLSLDTVSGLLYFSICFSPDNSKLYATSYLKYRLYQFDLSVYNLSAIDNSKTLIDSMTNSSDIKSGPDDKLYYFNKDATILKRIDYPNRVGMACQPVSVISGLRRASGSNPRMFPNVVPLTRVDTVYAVKHNTVCSDEVVMQPSDTSSLWFRWDDGSTKKVRSVAKSGTYWIQHGNYCHYRVDSFVIKMEDFPSPVITIKVFELGTVASYRSYQWLLNGLPLQGATDSTYEVTQNGNYTVIVSNEQGCTDTSDIYSVKNYTSIDAFGALAKDIYIYPNPVLDQLYINAPIKVNVNLVGIEGKWIKGKKEAHSISLEDIADGIYLLCITDTKGRLLKVEKLVKAR